jgi:Uma2 family endonuclease
MMAEVLEKKVVQLYSLEEYFELEEKAAYKSEFHNGKIVKMAGGSFEHNTIKLTISALLFMLSIKRNDLIVFDSDQKIYFPKYNHSVFADVGVIRGKKEMYKGGNQAVLNPCLIIEVLLDSTERCDKGGKFHKYKSLPSFEEYVLINQYAPIIDILTRTEDGWLMKTYIGLEEAIYFKSIDVTLKMADIYLKVEHLKDPQAVLEFDGDVE